MQLVINTRGSYIRKRGECFEIKVEDKKQEISARKVQSILITTAVLISTDAILLAHENNIDIIFLDTFGEPYSRVWHSRFGSTAYMRRMQLEYSSNEKGLILAKEWICQKIDNQIDLLKRLKKTREIKKETIESYIQKIYECKDKIESIDCKNIEPVRNNIFASEAQAGKQYFSALNFIIPDQYKFSGRSRRPAKDPFNALLNYGYGILYSRMERACILSGLDPFIGFLHTDNYGKKSFVFDIIEIFRIYVDEIVLKLFSKRMVK
ncbi:CRISPR-associated protein Cas1, partial [Candidatus Magnetomorum sp. HK-1]